MTGNHQNLAIGVDAGGTRTTGWLGSAAGGLQDPPIGTGEAGAGNPSAVGFDRCTAEITAAIRAAWNDAGLQAAPVNSLCLCVAGAGRPREQKRLRQWALSQNFATAVTVSGDAEPVLAAAAPDSVGIALISGTGSMAWGRSADGTTQRAGGWGHLLGDDGSGYAIAAAGLRAAARAADERGQPTRLLRVISERVGASTPFELMEWAYSPETSQRHIAACAELVFAVASHDHDSVAQGILDRAGAELADMVTTLARRIGFESGRFPLGLAGGVLTNQPTFRSDVVRRIGIPPGSTIVVTTPASGALTIARRVATAE